MQHYSVQQEQQTFVLQEDLQPFIEEISALRSLATVVGVAGQLLEAIKKHSVFLDTQLIGQVGQPTERNRLAHQEYVGFATPNIRYSSDHRPFSFSSKHK